MGDEMNLLSLLSLLGFTLVGRVLFAIANANAAPPPIPPLSMSLPAAPVPFSQFETNNFVLTGAEFWPTRGTTPFKYPEDVVWGFSPNNVSQESIDCARRAHRELHALLANPPADLKLLRNYGATPAFYLWTNDYKTADASMQRRSSRAWHWASQAGTGTKEFSEGFWKWESVLTQNGECQTPAKVETLATFKAARIKLGAAFGFDAVKTRFEAAATAEDKAAHREEFKYIFAHSTDDAEKEKIRVYLAAHPEQIAPAIPVTPAARPGGQIHH
jgi:hypothetical protein